MLVSSARHAGTPLHHAAKRGLENTVKLLLSRGGMFSFHSTAWSVWFLGYICCCLYLNMTLLNVWQQTHLFLMMIVKHHLRSLESKGSVMLYVQLRYVFWYPPLPAWSFVRCAQFWFLHSVESHLLVLWLDAWILRTCHSWFICSSASFKKSVSVSINLYPYYQSLFCSFCFKCSYICSCGLVFFPWNCGILISLQMGSHRTNWFKKPCKAFQVGAGCVC